MDCSVHALPSQDSASGVPSARPHGGDRPDGQAAGRRSAGHRVQLAEARAGRVRRELDHPGVAVPPLGQRQAHPGPAQTPTAVHWAAAVQDTPLSDVPVASAGAYRLDGPHAAVPPFGRGGTGEDGARRVGHGAHGGAASRRHTRDPGERRVPGRPRPPQSLDGPHAAVPLLGQRVRSQAVVAVAELPDRDAAGFRPAGNPGQACVLRVGRHGDGLDGPPRTGARHRGNARGQGHCCGHAR